MKVRPLGKTGLEVSEVGFGAWAIGGPADMGGRPIGWGEQDPEEAQAAIRRSAEMGVNFFDTADVYGMGASEELLGKVFGPTGWKGVLVGTKVGNVRLPDGGHRKDFSRGHLEKSLGGSLRRLKKEVVDLYQLHGPSLAEIRRGEVFDELERLRRAGKIRAWGVSIGTGRVDEAKALFETGRAIGAIQLVVNLLRREMEPEVLPECARRGIGVIARVPLQYGWLSGKFAADTTFPADDHRSLATAWERKRIAGEVDRLRFLVRPERTLAQAALQYVISNPAVSTTIPGARRPRQAEENARVSDLGPLSPEDLARVRETLGPPRAG